MKRGEKLDRSIRLWWVIEQPEPDFTSPLLGERYLRARSDDPEATH